MDRLKDMIISGGENVYPAEIERVIATLPAVAEVAVVGRADERWGEVPIAFVVRKDPTLTESAVIDSCRASLARFKCVQAVQFVEQLPRNPVGKVLKGDLRVAAAALPRGAE